MIEATFSAHGDSLTMTVKGHSDAAPKGADIICAGASTLAYTVAQCLSYMHEDGQLQKRPSIKLASGDTTITAKPKTDAYAETLHLFYVALVGLDMLSHAYPDNVRVIPFENLAGKLDELSK